MKQNKNDKKKDSNYDAYIGCSNDRLFYEALETLWKKGDRKTFSMQFGEWTDSPHEAASVFTRYVYDVLMSVHIIKDFDSKAENA